jgi:hypothetical protein
MRGIVMLTKCRQQQKAAKKKIRTMFTVLALGFTSVLTLSSRSTKTKRTNPNVETVVVDSK